MARTYEYEEITRKCIGYGSKHCYIPFHIEGKHEYKEPYHHDKQYVDRRRETQSKHFIHHRKQRGALI